MGEKLADLSDEDNQLRYITRFVLWANYDIPGGWVEKISANLSFYLITGSKRIRTD